MVSGRHWTRHFHRGPNEKYLREPVHCSPVPELQRIYVDTSVVGGCEDPEFTQWSTRLFNDFRKGSRIAVISDLTLLELEMAPESVQIILDTVPNRAFEYADLSEQAETLAHRYLDEGVVGEKHVVDAQHIAIATVRKVDVLVSWIFQQIVNLKRILRFNNVNTAMGYPSLEIRSPREVLHE